MGSEMNVEVKTDSTLGPSYPGYDQITPSSMDKPYSYATSAVSRYPSSAPYANPGPGQDNVYSVGYNTQNGYSQDNIGGYSNSQYPGNYLSTGGSNPMSYASSNPGYSTANTNTPTTYEGSNPHYGTAPQQSVAGSNAQAYGGTPQPIRPSNLQTYGNTPQQSIAGSNPQTYGATPQPTIPESHPSSLQQQQPTSAYPTPSALPESSQNYGVNYQGQQTVPNSQYASTSSESYPSFTMPSYADVPYSNHYSQGTPSTQYSAGGTSAYASVTSYPGQQTSQTGTEPNVYYPYPTSSTPVTNPTYVHSSSQPSPYANTYASPMSYPSTASPAPQYGYQYPTADTYSQYPSSTTQNTAYTYDQNGQQYANAANSSQSQYGNQANTAQYQYGNSVAPQSQYGSSATPQSQYGNAAIVPQSQYGNSSTSQEQYGSTATPQSQYRNPTSSAADYSNISLSQPAYGQSFNASVTPTCTQNTHLPYVNTGTPLPQANQVASSFPQNIPVSQPYHSTNYPSSFSPYTPDQKYPSSSPSYSYNFSYSNAGHPSYLQTQSSAYSSHEVSSSSQNYYNVPYGTQSYMQANGNSYVNTTPSTLTSPEAGTPHVMSPTGSQYTYNPTNYQNTTANSQYNTSSSQHTNTSSQYNSPSGPKSNVDLLADLDINITQSALIPASSQMPASNSSSQIPTSNLSSQIPVSNLSSQAPVSSHNQTNQLSSQMSNLSLTSGGSTCSQSNTDVKGQSSAEGDVSSENPSALETKVSC